MVLTESDVLAHTGPDVYARGEAYYHDGNVRSLSARGDEIVAEVRGTAAEPYVVTLTERDGHVGAVCTCPYRGGDWCKHAVAAALTWIRGHAERESTFDAVGRGGRRPRRRAA